MKRLLLLSKDANSARLRALAQFMGVEAELVDSVLPVEDACWILRAADFEAMLPSLELANHAVLVYDIESSGAIAREVGLERRRVGKFEIAATDRELTKVLAGQTVDSPGDCCVFSGTEGFTSVISADGRPFLL